MTSIAITLVLIIVAGALPGRAPGMVAAQGPIAKIRREPVGVSFTTDEASGTYTQIYSVVIGSPEQGEALASTWTSRFGMHGLDGTLWVRGASGDDATWKRVALRRPRSSEEVVLFVTQPGAFQNELRGGPSILPTPFGSLSPRELAMLDYIVSYESGGTRALFKVGTTAHEAETVLGSLARGLREVPLP